MNVAVGVFIIVQLLLNLLVSSCSREPLQDIQDAMRPSFQGPASLEDDLGREGLMVALSDNITYLKTSPRAPKVMTFGNRSIKTSQYVAALELLLRDLEKNHDTNNSAVRDYFELHEVYGNKDWGDVFVTSYFDPVIKGSSVKTEVYSQPIYGLPEDLVTIDLKAFAPTVSSLAEYLNGRSLEQKSSGVTISGRYVPHESGVGRGLGRVAPYFSRHEIDQKNALAGRGLELAYVDPVDAFFLQIQGSGIISLETGEQLRVGYAGQNGHPYVAIGKHLFDVIPRESMSMQAIERHLRGLSQDKMRELLDLNPSYVFFRELNSRSITYMGSEVISGRTIATDRGLFPKGALGFLEFEKPVFEHQDATTPSHWQKASRFVIDQDTGGAIRGPGRLDLYWGEGDEARQVAGVMKNPGKLFYLVPKPDVLERIAL